MQSNDNIKIKFYDPSWWSNLANIILDLEKLRWRKIFWKIPPHIFFQLKNIFQILETLGSARIEWNNTTLSEYVEKIIEKKEEKNEDWYEIENLEKAIKFIEENTKKDTKIDRFYISEIHKIVTKNLNKEWSKNPWELRKSNVIIKNSKHTPPDFSVLQDYFEEFLKFINDNHLEQYQLLMVALAHHRFAYIHPFDNWNGRTWRLLNYAFLIKLWFLDKKFRIINPSSVFYTDRDKYYNMLSLADSLEKDSLLKWSEYFLLWLKNEIEKIDTLLDKKYVQEKILIPVIDFALDHENITKNEAKILKFLISKDKMLIKSEELWVLWFETSLQKARVMKKLREKNIVYSIKEWGRVYTINFVNSYLLRWIIKVLKNEWFVSDFLNKN